MVAAGFAWFATSLSASDNDLLFTIGISLDALFPAICGHLLIAFPSGRLETRAERWVVGCTYFTVTVLQLPSLLFEEPGTPKNLLIVHGDQPLSDALDAMQLGVAVVILAVSWVLIIRRARAGGPAQRRALVPVLVTGGAAFAVFLVSKIFDAAGHRSDALEWASQALVATIPFGFLVGLLRTRLAQGAAVSELVARLGQAPGEAELRAALADALGDPTLALAYWLPHERRFVDAAGREVTMPERGWTEVELQGRRIAAIVHDPALSDERDLVRAAGGAAALALENQRLSAELRARIEDLRASRTRVVSAGDTARRRFERDLHDGAQSRLVALALKLRLARMAVDDESEAAGAARRVERRAAGARSTSSASSPVACTRSSSPTAASTPRCGSSPAARRSRSTSSGSRTIGSRPRSSSPSTSLSRRPSPTSRSTRAPPPPACRSASPTVGSPSRSPTTARAAPTSRAARVCVGWRTAWRPSTATSSSTRPPAPARACGPRSPSRTTEAAQLSGLMFEVELVGLEPTTFALPARRSPS